MQVFIRDGIQRIRRDDQKQQCHDGFEVVMVAVVMVWWYREITAHTSYKPRRDFLEDGRAEGNAKGAGIRQTGRQSRG